MKRFMHSNEDWRTDTPDPMINAFREIMAESIDEQDNPMVGIFWYDTDENELFGVVETLSEDRPYQKTDLFKNRARTVSALHENKWQKEFHRKKDKRFFGDYTKVPRGRVFEVENEGFVVCVGSWIQEYPEAKEEILYEFQLPKNTQFKIDEHWELGHGWSW